MRPATCPPPPRRSPPAPLLLPPQPPAVASPPAPLLLPPQPPAVATPCCCRGHPLIARLPRAAHILWRRQDGAPPRRTARGTVDRDLLVRLLRLADSPNSCSNTCLDALTRTYFAANSSHAWTSQGRFTGRGRPRCPVSRQDRCSQVSPGGVRAARAVASIARGGAPATA